VFNEGATVPSDRIRGIIDEFASKLEEAIRAEVQERLRHVADGMVDGKEKSATTVYLKGKKNIPDHCRQPGCKKPHCGGRYGFFCEEHRPERYLRPGPESEKIRRRQQRHEQERKQRVREHELEVQETPPVLTAVPEETTKPQAAADAANETTDTTDTERGNGQ
jgi:hypothetical protein